MEFLGVLLVVALAVGSIVLLTRRSQDVLERWAARCGFRILSRERRLLRRGPFWWRTSEGQVVFYVIVQDRDGNVRRGWVRCGSWLLGLWSDETTVRWP